jgi:hypothetical protein
MSLEKTLAEIEVLAEEARSRSFASSGERYPWFKIDRVMQGIINQPVNILEKYKKAKKAMKGDKIEEASLYLTEFCLDIKNLADSVNLYLQAVYGVDKPSLNRIRSNTQNAPLTREGKSLSDVFLEVHDNNRTNEIIALRNMKGHAQEYSALQRWNSPSGFVIALPNDKAPFGKDLGKDAGQWLDEQIETYFGMTKTILETTLNNDAQYLKGSRVKRKSALMQRLKNFVSEYKKPVQIALAAALISTGILGTLGYQKISDARKDADFQRFVHKIESEGPRAFDKKMDEKSFYLYKSQIVRFSEKLGEKLKREYSSLSDDCDEEAKKEMKNYVEEYLKRKDDFMVRLKNLSYDSCRNGEYSPCLSDLSTLWAEQIFMRKMQQDVFEKMVKHPKRYGKYDKAISEAMSAMRSYSKTIR